MDGVLRGKLPLYHLKIEFFCLTIVSFELFILNINSFLRSLQIFSSCECLKEVDEKAKL